MHDGVWRELSTGARHVRQGQARRFALRGSVGLGKSALLQRLKADLVDHTFRVLSATGFSEEAHTPYAGLHQLLWPLRDEIGASSDPRLDALTTKVLTLTAAPGDGSVPVALLRLFSMLAEQSPLAVLVDDFHWVDQSSREALLFAARRLEADAVLAVIAFRPEELTLTHNGLVSLDLAPLDSETARSLLRLWHPDLCAPVINRLESAAGGVPLALREAPLELSPNQRRGISPLPQSLPVGAALTAHYASRLATLGAPARLALTAAAVEHLDRHQLLQLLGALDLGVDVLDSAVSAGLVRLTDDGLSWRHPTLRAAVLESATPGDLTIARTSLLTIVSDDVAALARLHDALATGPDDTAAHALETAAEHASARSAYAEAGHFLVRAARRSATPAEGRRRLELAAKVLAQQQPTPTFIRVLRQLADEAPTREQRAHWECQLLDAEGYPFSPPPPGDLVSFAQEFTGPMRAALLRRLATHYLMTFDFASAREMVALAHLGPHDAIDQADRIGLDAAACVVGGPQFETMSDRGWLRTLKTSDFIDPGFPMTFGLTVVGWLGHLHEANDASLRRVQALEEEDMIGALSSAVTHEGTLQEAMGRLVEARAAYERGMRLAEAADLGLILFHAVGCQAGLAARMGELELAENLLRSLPADARTHPSPVAQLVLVAQANVALATDDLATAAQLLGSAHAMEEELGIKLPAFSPRFADQVCVLGLLGRQVELEAVLTSHQDNSRNLPVGARSGLELAAAALLEGSHSDHWGEAEVRAQLADNPFDVARVQLLRGHQLRLSGQKAEAVPQLRAARSGFEKLGALALLRQAERQLSACGERRAPDAPTGGLWAQFTPREYDVVRLVVAGASNAEAAERLYLSRRTIEYHVANAMRKLAVSSRADLAAALAAETAH